MRSNIRVPGIVAFLVTLLIVGHSPRSHALENYSDLIAKASESLDRFDSEEWAYTETAETPDGIFVGRYDARRPDGERWTLDRVDDRDPTEEERQEFVTRKLKNAESNKDGDDDTIEKMVKIPTLKLIEESDSHWVFNFEPQGDDDDEAFMEHVRGELTIAKAGPHISAIRLRNTEPFKPGFGIKVSEFLTVMQFAPVSDEGQIAPISVDFMIKARAFAVKNVEEQSKITYSDYEYVGGASGA